MKPNEEQIKRFWEWCGFEYLEDPIYRGKYWRYPTWTGKPPLELPPIDLNNLFKYAVPKIENFALEVYEPRGDKNWTFLLRKTLKTIKCYCPDCCGEYVGYSPKPALALFWAIYKAVGLED